MDAPPRPAKVLWISCVGEKGGAEVYLLNFVRHLDPDRYTAGVAVLRDGPLVPELRAARAAVHLFARHRMRQIHRVAAVTIRLARLIRRENYHVVHSNGFRAHVYGGIAARLAGVPEVWSVHTAEKPGLDTSLIAALPTHHVTANCPRTAADFRARRLPVSLIWPGVEFRPAPAPEFSTAVARRHGLPAGARWIAMAARMQRYKGQEFLVRTLASLPDRHRDLHAFVIGGALFEMETSLVDELRRLATALGVADRVHFPGFVPDAELHALVAGSEFMVHPALDEDFGLIVAESQALGKAVVAFASVGPAAILDSEATGILVPIGDQSALNRAVLRLLDHPELARQFGTAGIQRVARHFAAPEATRKLQLLYDACRTGAADREEPWDRAEIPSDSPDHSRSAA